MTRWENTSVYRALGTLSALPVRALSRLPLKAGKRRCGLSFSQWFLLLGMGAMLCVPHGAWNNLYAVLFALIGFGAGMLAAYLINNGIFPFLVTCLAAFLLTAFCQMFRLWIFHGASFWRLLAVALGQSVFSLPLAVPYYYISRAFHRRRAQR